MMYEDFPPYHPAFERDAVEYVRRHSRDLNESALQTVEALLGDVSESKRLNPSIALLRTAQLKSFGDIPETLIFCEMEFARKIQRVYLAIFQYDFVGSEILPEQMKILNTRMSELLATYLIAPV